MQNFSARGSVKLSAERAESIISTKPRGSCVIVVGESLALGNNLASRIPYFGLEFFFFFMIEEFYFYIFFLVHPEFKQCCSHN